jgi:hypothetical protein
MPRLFDLQRDFARAIRSESPVAHDLDIESGNLTSARRIAIYRNHHRISLATALAANFPTVARVVGAEPFHALALNFVAENPLRDPRLENYGDGLPEFLADDERLGDLPYIFDVARLDRALNRAERAPDAPIFGSEQLEALLATGLGDLRLWPHPTASLLSSRYPLLRIRELANAPDNSTMNVALDEGGVEVAIWCREDGVRCVALDHATYVFLGRLSAGDRLGEAIGSLDEDALPTVFAQYVITGFFTMPA